MGALRLVTPPASGHHSVVIRSTVPPGTIEEVVVPALAAGLAGAPVTAGAAMCPEFLREGSGVADFFASPLVVVGTADPRVADAVTSLFGFLEQPVRVVETRTAESLKYACNAFHATKVSFANEMSRLLRVAGVDSREVMSLFCEDRVLNISPAYLRPGFAFGGSCLPKDLRSLLHLARTNSVDLPMLAGTLATNELTISDIVDRVVACDGRTVALLGLSFKANTDDLRESPNAELAERLIGKGFDVRIYDPVVNPARLIGANRRHIEAKLPHLGRLLTHEPGEALRGADVAIVSSVDPAIRAALLGSPAASPVRPERPARPARSNRCPVTRGSAGEPRPHHRPEPAGALRPAGLAGVPGAPSRRATRSPSSAPRARTTPPTKSSTACGCTSTGPTRRAAASSASSPSTPTRSSRRPG